MQRKFVKKLTDGLDLYQYHEIPVLELNHRVGKAKIALQGAQIFSWQPAHAAQDVFWLSDIEPFKSGNAIRGGVPVCYPWFGANGQPAHGYARIRLWELSAYDLRSDQVQLEFSLFSGENRLLAKMTMRFSDDAQLTFSHGAEQDAQVALHSYFNIGDIRQTSIENLPTRCFDQLAQQEIEVPSPRTISENVDCIYPAAPQPSVIQDRVHQRQITVEHINASEIVLWNPWHKPTGNMSENGYETMVCVETARISRRIHQEPVSVKIGVKYRE